MSDLTDDAQSEQPKKKKDNSADMAFKEGFQYSHENPYHDKLSDFDKFVLRDDEGEAHSGNWAKEVFDNNGEIQVEIGTGYGCGKFSFSVITVSV